MPSGNGYWLITQSGNVYAFGDAPFYGAPGNQGSPVTSAVRTADGHGYWVLLANGAVDAYGDAVGPGRSDRFGRGVQPGIGHLLRRLRERLLGGLGPRCRVLVRRCPE